MHIGGNCVNIW